MKKCVKIFIFLAAVSLFLACDTNGYKQNSSQGGNASAQQATPHTFVLADTTALIPIDTLVSDSPCLSIALSLEVAAADHPHATAINNIITYAAYGHEASTPMEATRLFANEITSEYHNLRAEYINVRDVDNSPKWLNFKYDIQGRVHETHNGIINYIIKSDIYTGGPHAHTTHTYINIDNETGQEITLDDIFTECYEEPLTHIIANALTKIQEKENNPHHPEVHEIFPIDNFILGKDSIVFLYNSDGMASHSRKETRIAIGLNEIDKLLKKQNQE